MKLTRKDNSSLFYMFTLFIALILAIFFCIPQKSGKDTTQNIKEVKASSGFTNVIQVYSTTYTGSADRGVFGMRSSYIYRIMEDTFLVRASMKDTNGIVVFYIPKGITFEIDATDYYDGGAAVEVPSGSKLIVVGGGKLIAKDDNA